MEQAVFVALLPPSSVLLDATEWRDDGLEAGGIRCDCLERFAILVQRESGVIRPPVWMRPERSIASERRSSSLGPRSCGAAKVPPPGPDQLLPSYRVPQRQTRSKRENPKRLNPQGAEYQCEPQWRTVP